MHGKFTAPTVAYLAFALAACRGDSTGTAPLTVAPPLLESRHQADEAPRFPAWSAPVNLGPPVNTPFIEQAASLSRDGRSLYFHCGNCPGSIGGADIYVSQRASVDAPWGPPQNLGPTINTTPHEPAARPAPGGRPLLFSTDRP